MFDYDLQISEPAPTHEETVIEQVDIPQQWAVPEQTLKHTNTQYTMLKKMILSSK